MTPAAAMGGVATAAGARDVGSDVGGAGAGVGGEVTGDVAVPGGAGNGCTVPHPVTTPKIETHNEAAMRKKIAMIESGMWIFFVEAAVAGCLFTGLIWWVVRGTADRDKKRREFDEKARNDADAAAKPIDNTDKR